MNKDSCIFCGIAQQQVPASLVYEDEKVIAFLDTKPLNEGQALITPKAHYETIFEIPQQLIAYLHGIVKRVTLAVEKVTKADRISIIQQNGKAAGQEISHLHVHVVPRYEGQKLSSFNEIPEANIENLSQTAAKIRKHI
jgi:histidine triad (HIT) family protein